MTSDLRSQIPSPPKACIATSVYDDGKGTYTTIPEELFDSTNPDITWNCANRIDCGTDENLFLTLAGLKIKEQTFEKYTDVVEKRIFGSSQMLSSITGVKIHPTKPLVGKNAFLHESGIHQHGILENPSTYEIINPVDIGIIQNELTIAIANKIDQAFI